MKKYYVVWEGHESGIYDNWEDCRRLIEGYPGARYKSFPSREAAEHAFYAAMDDFQMGGVPAKPSNTPAYSRGKEGPVLRSLAVDAACSGNPGLMEYQGVFVDSGQKAFHKGTFPMGTANIGEFLAIVHALAFLKQKNSHLPVYSDSKIAISWVAQGVAKTKLEHNQQTANLYTIIKRAEKWLEANQWKNKILKWDTKNWGEIPADFGNK